MRMSFVLLAVAAAVAAFLSPGAASAQQVLNQVCFAIDGSGSISSSDFTTEITGIGEAIKDSSIMPQDGSVEVSAVLFASTATTVVSPTVINSQAVADTVGNTIEGLAQPGGATNIEDAIDDCTAEITGSPNFAVAEIQEINITTDGVPTTSNSGGTPEGDAVLARDAALLAGIDYLDGELVNYSPLGGALAFMERLVWPPLAEVKTYPEPLLGITGFVYIVEQWQHYEPAVREKVPVVVGPRVGPHQKCYQIDGDTPGIPVDLTTQFGFEEDVIVGQATLLCPPALKDGEGNLDVPHLKCYDIVGDDPPDDVKLTTQFGIEEDVEVGPATRLCVPADKEVTYPDPVPPSGLVPETPHYKCYQIAGPAPGIPVDLETQFGVEPAVDVGEPALLCAPALKDGVGDLNAPHLECYNIIGVDPPHIVNLQTQFGFEFDVEVGPAQLLCVPAVKLMDYPTSVGGLAELPDVSDSSGRNYIALAGLGAAALGALSAGGWYARRRWLR